MGILPWVCTSSEKAVIYKLNKLKNIFLKQFNTQSYYIIL